MPSPLQPGLFDDLEPATDTAATGGTAVLRVPGAAASLSKAQKEFNRLNERLARLRGHLSSWRAAADALDKRRLTELVPAHRKLAAAQRETLMWIDAHLQQPPAGEKLGKKARAKLVAILRLLATEVLDAGPDADVEAAHDRHGPRSHRDRQRGEADRIAAMLGDAFGDDALFEGEADSVEDLMQRVAQRLQQQEENGDAAPAEPPPGHRPTRAEKARLRDAKALQDASQSVRDVYRRLASSLHPDREPDVDERARKTALMARANDAYAANDLLGLLAMQLELEHIDTDHLAGLPDERLRHYSRVLKEQQQSLEMELATLQMPVAVGMQAPPGLLGWPPAMLTMAFEEELDEMRAALRSIGHDAQLLRDPRTRAEFLRVVEVEDPDDAIDAVEAIVSRPPAAADRRPRAGRGGRRRRG